MQALLKQALQDKDLVYRTKPVMIFLIAWSLAKVTRIGAPTDEQIEE